MLYYILPALSHKVILQLRLDLASMHHVLKLLSFFNAYVLTKCQHRICRYPTGFATLLTISTQSLKFEYSSLNQCSIIFIEFSHIVKKFRMLLSSNIKFNCDSTVLLRNVRCSSIFSGHSVYESTLLAH